MRILSTLLFHYRKIPFIFFSFLYRIFILTSDTTLKICEFDQIYQLGDSISDTGNLIREYPIGPITPFARLPYGETFFGNATGRCSDGLLMIDYIALAAGLPFLNPYKNADANFSHGVNFAVAGATALGVDVLADNNISSGLTSSSLSVQLDWMSTHFSSICYSNRDCAEKLRNSLFMVGEIGGNDINYASFQGKTIEEVQSMVPAIVRAIMDAVRREINYASSQGKIIEEIKRMVPAVVRAIMDAVLRIILIGAVRIVVPGNFPIGCLPIYLTEFQTNSSTAYNELHCLKEYNHLSMYYNEHLQQAIQELKQENPNAIIVYGDYYNAFMWLFRNAQYFGFDMASLEKSCCGTGGDYNCNLGRLCGAPGVPVCPNPHRHISWDGRHMTQEAYNMMARWIISDILPQLGCFR